MKARFADTSYYLLLLDKGEQRHRKAVQFAESPTPVVTTEFILLELGNALSRVANRTEFAILVQALRASPKVQIVPLASELMDRGFKLMMARADKEWSLTDCISFDVMNALEITEALTTDHHIDQAGFNALLTE